VDGKNIISRNLNAEIRKLAKNRGWTLVDQEQNFKARVGPALYSDDIHPSTIGYGILAEEFAATLSGLPRASIDLVPPMVVAMTPAPGGTVEAEAGATLDLTLKDYGLGIDLAAIVLRVDGLPVAPLLSGAGTELTLSYTPATPWAAGQVVSLVLDLADLATPANSSSFAAQFSVVSALGKVRNQPAPDGDIDGSGRVDGGDLIRLGLAFGASKQDTRFNPRADLDQNGVIDGADLAALAALFGRTL
jgi:hypothetical protein